MFLVGGFAGAYVLVDRSASLAGAIAAAGGFGAAWLWWSYFIPQWRSWAHDRGADPEELQQLAMRANLVWHRDRVWSAQRFAVREDDPTYVAPRCWCQPASGGAQRSFDQDEGQEHMRFARFSGALLLCCSPAWGAPVNITDQNITSLATGYGAEGFYVSTQGDLPAGADCGGGNRFILVPGHPMKAEMVALLLSAMQS